MNRIVLKNVPISMTKEQITSMFFSELENIDISFPKRSENDMKRNVIIQLNSKNEELLCIKFINLIGYQNVEASSYVEDSNENKSVAKKEKYFIKVMDKFMKPSCEVVITSVTNSRLLYIRPLCNEADDLIDLVSSYSKISPVVLEKPSINEYVLAPFNNYYHRAKVLDLFVADQNGFNTRVVLTDLGNEVKLKWQDLKHLNYKIRGRPSFTQKVILDDVPSEKYCQKVVHYLQKLALDKEKLEVVKISGNQIHGLKVILKHSQTGAIINEVVLSMLQDGRDKKYFYDASKVPKFSTDSAIKMFVSDYSQLEDQKLLSCIPYEKFSDYFLMLDELQKYYKRVSSNEPYLPVLNEICIVKYNDRWHRASCSDNNSQSEFIKFTLIDLMINAEIIKNSIRKIPQSFAQHFYTSLCYVEGINDLNVGKIKDIIEKDKFIHANIRYDSETQFPVLNNLFY